MKLTVFVHKAKPTMIDVSVMVFVDVMVWVCVILVEHLRVCSRFSRQCKIIT